MLTKIKEYKYHIWIAIGVSFRLLFYYMYKGVDLTTLNLFEKIIAGYIPEIIWLSGLFFYSREKIIRPKLRKILMIVSMTMLLGGFIFVLLQIINSDKTYFHFYYELDNNPH